jgi:hypothetical protein
MLRAAALIYPRPVPAPSDLPVRFCQRRACGERLTTGAVLLPCCAWARCLPNPEVTRFPQTKAKSLLEKSGSMLCAPVPHSLGSNSLIRPPDAINRMTLK